MRVLKTEDCFYVAGGNASDTNTGDFGDVGNMGASPSDSDDSDCAGRSRWSGLKALGKEISIGLGINGLYDAITGMFSNNGAPGNPGTGNPMGDPGPSWGDNRSDR